MTLHPVQSFESPANGSCRASGPAPSPIARDGRGLLPRQDMVASTLARSGSSRSTKGGPALRAMGFHDRARMLKALAAYLNERRAPLYRLSHRTGATMADNRIDIDGGIGTMFVIASKGAARDAGRRRLSRRRARGAVAGRQFRGPACLHGPCRGWRSISTRSTFPSGACWKSSRRRFWRACRPS